MPVFVLFQPLFDAVLLCVRVPFQSSALEQLLDYIDSLVPLEPPPALLPTVSDPVFVDLSDSSYTRILALLFKAKSDPAFRASLPARLAVHSLFVGLSSRKSCFVPF